MASEGVSDEKPNPQKESEKTDRLASEQKDKALERDDTEPRENYFQQRSETKGKALPSSNVDDAVAGANKESLPHTANASLEWPAPSSDNENDSVDTHRTYENNENVPGKPENHMGLDLCHNEDVSVQAVRQKSGSFHMSDMRKLVTTGTTTIVFKDVSGSLQVVSLESKRSDSTDIKDSSNGPLAKVSRSKAKSKKLSSKDFPRLVSRVSPGNSDISDESDDEAQSQGPPGADPERKTAKKVKYITEPVYVTELHDNNGYALLREEDITPRSGKFTKNASFVLEVVRVVDSRLNPWSEKSQMKQSLETGLTNAPLLRIISPWLLAVLERVGDYHPQSDLSHTLTLPYPFALLVHHRKELQAFKASNPDNLGEEDLAERNRHIDCALAVVQAEHGGELEMEDVRLARDTPTTIFKNYWIHLKPGTMVYKTQRGLLTAYIINSVTGGVSEGRVDQYTISLWNLNYDGRTFGRCSETEFLKPFSGEQAINSLPIYPVEFHIDVEGKVPLRESLITRGQRFMSLTRRTHCSYNGPSLTSPRHTYTGQIMIDTALLPWEEVEKWWFTPVLLKDAPEFNRKTKRRYGPRYGDDEEDMAQINRVPQFEGWDQLTVDSQLTPDQLFLCSYYVFGYVLSARKWEVLDVGKITDRDPDPGLMEKLVISTENKQLIKAICRDYTIDHKDWTADIIPGKGEGQIFLLHGRPGVGKTLTAECVAEYTNRPLLAITPGDIGTSPSQVEQTLNKFFELGERWGAILLLDEADVFLESRTESDLERNSLVSVFLRALEYYQGILFLTTNRVGSFDEAFASRIHVSIHYGDLGAEGRETIWENLFDDIESDRPEVRVEYSARSFVKEDTLLRNLEWNGRQIRNGFRTAVSLAEFEAAETKSNTTPCRHCKQPGHTQDTCWVKHPEKRSKKVFIRHQHLESVTKMSRRFKDYLKSTKDADDAKLAKMRSLRNDRYVEGQDRGAIQK